MIKINGLLSILACPACKRKLLYSGDEFRCLKCKKNYVAADKVYFHSSADNVDKWSEVSTGLTGGDPESPKFDIPFGFPNDFEGFARPAIEHIGGPRIAELRKHLSLSPAARMLYLGSGGDDYKDYIKLDYFPYKNVDIVADIHKLPFRTATLDCVVTNSVFEHLRSPEVAFKEACRVIRKGGFLYFCVPFMIPRHHQIDYWRWTLQGIANMAQKSKMTILDYGATRGFAYAMAIYLDAISRLPLQKGLRSYIRRNGQQMNKFFSQVDTVLDYHHPLRTAFASTLFVLMRR